MKINYELQIFFQIYKYFEDILESEYFLSSTEFKVHIFKVSLNILT